MPQKITANRPTTEKAPATDAEVGGIPFAKNPHPMWIFDRETLAFLEVNQAAIRKYGYSRAEFLAMTILDIRPAEDVPEMVRRTRVRGAATGLECRHRTRYGTVIPIAVTSWQLIFRGRPSELVLARWQEPVDAAP
jgi:PAS domain S-box-containing protein